MIDAVGPRASVLPQPAVRIHDYRINIHLTIDAGANRYTFRVEDLHSHSSNHMISLRANNRLLPNNSINNGATGRFCAATNTDS